MNIRYSFLVLSGVLMVLCYIPYIKAILRKDNPAKPMKATWLIWASLDIVTALGMYAEGKLNAQISCAVVGASLIFFLSLWRGQPGWGKIDVACLYICLLAIVLWQAYDSPLLGILMSSVGNFVGSVPTWISAWQDCRRENKASWLIATGSSLCSLAAMQDLSPGSLSQPLVFLSIQLVTLYLIFGRAMVPISVCQTAQCQV